MAEAGGGGGSERHDRPSKEICQSFENRNEHA